MSGKINWIIWAEEGKKGIKMIERVFYPHLWKGSFWGDIYIIQTLNCGPPCLRCIHPVNSHLGGCILLIHTPTRTNNIAAVVHVTRLIGPFFSTLGDHLTWWLFSQIPMWLSPLDAAFLSKSFESVYDHDTRSAYPGSITSTVAPPQNRTNPGPHPVRVRFGRTNHKGCSTLASGLL